MKRQFQQIRYDSHSIHMKIKKGVVETPPGCYAVISVKCVAFTVKYLFLNFVKKEGKVKTIP
jgi:hypothetical protein